MLVPQKFCCPSACVEWPQELWGFKLGTFVSMIRGNKRLQTQRQVCPNKSNPSLSSLTWAVQKRRQKLLILTLSTCLYQPTPGIARDGV